MALRTPQAGLANSPVGPAKSSSSASLSYITPYLGLQARLSQIWINRWTVLLLLILVRFLFAVADASSSLTIARRETLRACIQVESTGSSMASMPHYMAVGVNEVTASGIDKAVSGLTFMLEMAVTSVEEIVLFVVHMMTSTYLCLITLAVRGSMKAVAEVGSKTSDALQKNINDVTDSLGDTSKTLTDSFNDVLEKVKSVPFMDDFEPPSIDFTDQINKLKSLQVPPELQERVDKLDDSIPTFEEVQDFVDNLIRNPFEEVKKRIQGMSTFHFDRALLPVPQKEQLDFCSRGNSISGFFDELIQMVGTARKIALIVLIIFAILVCIPMAWAELRRYRKMEGWVEQFKDTKDAKDAMDMLYLASRPHSSSYGQWLGGRFRSSSHRNAVRWVFAYATSLPMLFVLTLGVAGLLSCFAQFLLLKSIQRAAPKLTSQVADFAGEVIKSLDNSSASWSGGVNDAIRTLDERLNDDVFGFVNTTTTAINGTLDAFVDRTSKELEDAFGGTILHDPIKEVLNCLIGLKIASFQRGLTWVQEHTHISFPSVKNDTFTLGALAPLSGSDSAADLLAVSNGKAKDEITEAMGRAIDKLASGIHTEALISGAVVCYWLLATAGGAIYICVVLASQRRVRKAWPLYGSGIRR